MQSIIYLFIYFQRWSECTNIWAFSTSLDQNAPFLGTLTLWDFNPSYLSKYILISSCCCFQSRNNKCSFWRMFCVLKQCIHNTVITYIWKYQGKLIPCGMNPLKMSTTGDHTSRFSTRAAFSDWYEQCCGWNELF